MTERDWEAAARRRVEGLLAGVVDLVRATASEIERESKQALESAAKTERDYDWQGYPRVAGQTIHSIQTMIFNLKLDSLVEAAADAERAYHEKQGASE